MKSAPIFPSRRVFERLRRSGSSVSFVAPAVGTARGPEGVRDRFEPIARSAVRPMLLESSRTGGATGRYSILLGDPAAVFRSRGKAWALTPARAGAERDGRTGSWPARKGTGDPLLALRAITRKHASAEAAPLPFAGGAAGLFTFEFKNRIEKFRTRVRDPWRLPDVDLGFYDRGLAVDHAAGRTHAFRWFSNAEARRMSYEACVDEVRAVGDRWTLPSGRSRATVPHARLRGRLDAGRNQFIRAVDTIRRHIRKGDVYQVNLSQLLSFDLEGDLYALYRRQARSNPTSFSAYADLGACALVSASPERLIQVRGRAVATRPIAGTRPRSADPRQDRRLTSELLLSPKERAEHVMLVDLERNDLGRVCRPGTVRVDELMAVEAYSHVKHIVSNVVGELQDGRDVWDVIRAVFPGGTITGAPKVRAMELIDRLEKHARGPYTGSLGYAGFDGNADWNIVIRTLWARGGRAYLQAGAGIVADSDPQKEYEETLHKAGAFLDVLGLGSVRP